VKLKDPKAAIKHFLESLTHSPTNANAYHNLGVAYAEMHKHDKALINYNLTVHFDPRCAEAYNNMGILYKEQGNWDKAIKSYHMALQCNPRFAQALNNLGVAYTTIGRLTEALEYLSRAAVVAPNYAEVYNNLGWLFWDHGDLAQALRMYERCIELSPSSKNPSQNRLLALNYLHDVSPERVCLAHTAWAERFCHEAGLPFTDWLVEPVVKRKLRIGYISPDFFHHSVSFFCHALFQFHDREQFEIHLYSNATREDEKTELFKSMVAPEHWKKVVGRSAVEVANMIREDRIDILVELAGHTANNRLDVIALKPAPVQITYIGYNNTTGLGAVDYRITDAIVDPPDQKQPFSEELVRLPGCFLCYTPPSPIPDVDPLPALKKGFVTFGSFSCLAKISEPCCALWARVLREVPNSRLLVKNKGFASPDVQATFMSRFKAQGIAEHRLRLLSLAPTSFEHLNIYNEVDIALDTFPYSNTTTSCETLLMGVPVVCLAGNTHGSRVGVTLLSAVGMPEYAADNADDYVAKAVRLAGNLPALAALRSNMRHTVLSSQLCDGPGFVRDKYERVLREMWAAFCHGRPPSKQRFATEELPDALAPGAFAPPLPPGAPLVQCRQPPPSTDTSAAPGPALMGVPGLGPSFGYAAGGLSALALSRAATPLATGAPPLSTAPPTSPSAVSRQLLPLPLSAPLLPAGAPMPRGVAAAVFGQPMGTAGMPMVVAPQPCGAPAAVAQHRAPLPQSVVSEGLAQPTSRRSMWRVKSVVTPGVVEGPRTAPAPRQVSVASPGVAELHAHSRRRPRARAQGRQV